MLKKGLAAAGIAFLIFFIANQPTTAAGVFRSIGNGVLDIARGIGNFFITLING